MPVTAEAGVMPSAALSHAGLASNDGVWLSWRAYGEGEPVLLIMGFMGSSRAWFRLLPHVAREHSAIVMDNRGTGDSDRPLGLWSMHDLASDARAVLDAAGVESAHVVGASMGGMIAQHLALDYPERVRSLTLTCTHAGGEPLGAPWRMAVSLALRPLFGPSRTFAISAPLLFSERTRRYRRERMDEDLAVRVADSTPGATALGQLAAIREHDTRERLAELDMPVLVLHGEQDRLVPVERGVDLAGRVPHAELRVLPDCGHIVTTDAEEEAAGALLDFLQRAG